MSEAARQTQPVRGAKDAGVKLPAGDVMERRATTFLMLQGLFIVASPFTGGFHKTVWSQLDTALLIISVGFTGLIFALEERWERQLAFRVGIFFYLLAVIDMAINMLIVGTLGWKGGF